MNLISQFTGIKLEKLEGISLSDLFYRPDALGFTTSQTKKLRMLSELISKSNEVIAVQEKTVLDSSTKAGDYIVTIFKTIMEVESFKIVWLDSRNQVIEVSTISTGTVNESSVYPRNVVKLGLNNNAVSAILCHNHPAGSLNPSNADIHVTKKIQEALNTVGIKVVDHIIATEGGYYNFSEHSML